MLRDFADSVAQRAGLFDPTIIIQIITALMTVFQNCKKSAVAAVRTGRVGFMQRARLAATLQAQGCRAPVRIAQAMVDEACDAQSRCGADDSGRDWVDQIAADVAEQLAAEQDA